MERSVNTPGIDDLSGARRKVMYKIEQAPFNTSQAMGYMEQQLLEQGQRL